MRATMRTGWSPVSGNVCISISSRPTPRKCGVFLSATCPRTGPRNGSRACHWARRLSTRCCPSATRRRSPASSVVAVSDDGTETVYEASAVISSMPMTALLGAMNPPVPPTVAKAVKDLHYRDFLTVALVVPEEFGFPDNWIYVHSPDVKLGRIQNFGSWSPYLVKEGRTCLGLEYFVFEGDEYWTMADEDLVALGKAELARLSLVDPSRVEAGYVVRMPKAYPYYDFEYKANVDVLRAWLAV